jgi:hypothetical protein
MIAVLCVLTLAPAATASDFGLGIIAGEPTGLSAKWLLSRSAAIDAAVAWSFEGGDDDFLVLADYVMHNFNLFDVDKGSLALYFGLGGRIIFKDDTQLGIRVPVGLDYMFQDTPLDIFGEIVPVLDLVDKTELNLNAGVGVRYFFGRTSYQ